MSVEFQILGAPGRDNALFVRINTGQAITRLLFDCGESCLAPLPLSEIQAIDHLFFSHFHMDHIGGFDSFFRGVYARTDRPNNLWGPPGAGQILQHRFRGFLWNLHEGLAVSWNVNDISPDRVVSHRFELGEAFAVAHQAGHRERGAVALEREECTVEAYQMDHRTPSLAYIVREKPRSNVDPVALAAMGLRPGPWLKEIKDPTSREETIVVEGVPYDRQQLSETLLVQTPGASIAYLTDFRLDTAAKETLTVALEGCATVVCESQYLHADVELAQRNYHMTARQVAELARDAGVGQLFLIHVSDRYQREGWLTLLAEAQAVFPNTRFAESWRL